MRRRSLIVLSSLTVSSTLAAARPAGAWNATGHEAVAQIAWDRLTPAARAKFAAVLERHPRRDKDLLDHVYPTTGPATEPSADESTPAIPAADRGHAMFLVAATWPDIVRSPLDPLNHTEHHGAWHACGFPYDRDGKAGPEPVTAWDGHSDPANLLQAMAKVTAELVAPGTPTPRRAIDLCWVEHLVGDIHQPLHAASLYEADLPDGDRGGNLDLVATGDAEHPTANLHAVWDGLEGGQADPAAVRGLADRIEGAHPPAGLVPAVVDQDVSDWAAESHALAVHDVYLDGRFHGLPRDAGGSPPPLPAGYADRARAVADERIALAGYRLADLLEREAAYLPPPDADRDTAAPTTRP